MVDKFTPRHKSKCEAVLARDISPSACRDVHERPRWVMCRAWELLNAGEAKTFHNAIKQSWNDFIDRCMANQRSSGKREELSHQQEELPRGNPFWSPRFRQVGPDEKALPGEWAIWGKALKAVRAEYPIGHPLLMAEAKRAGLTQEQTQELIANDKSSQEIRKFREEIARREEKRLGMPENEEEEEEEEVEE